MDDKEFEAISAGIRVSLQRFPKCRVASCECNEYGGEWQSGCSCPGHWEEMDKAFGAGGRGGQWSFRDAAASAKAGKPVRAE